MSAETWQQTLFGCFDNPVMCLWSCCVPCGLSCMQAIDAKVMFPEDDKAGVVACLMNCCLCCIGAAWNRKNIRDLFNYEGNYIVDCMLELFCCCCAVNQEWREVFAKKHNEPTMPIWKALRDKDHQSA